MLLSAFKEKDGIDAFLPFKQKKLNLTVEIFCLNGGSDGIRTRGLRRDRPAL